MVRLLVSCLVCLLSAVPAANAATDLAGSRDPAGMERFPRSWIVDYRREEDVTPREFIVGRVERLHRETRVQELRLDASLEAAIYRIPDGQPAADVAAHFLSFMEGGLLYRCAGRDCGRSNEWANQVFSRAILYGPDGNQHYFAWESQGRLVAVYIIERGNKQVYANVQVLTPGDASDIGANKLLARRLTGQGWSIVDDVLPGVDGGLPASAEQVFAALAPQFTGIANAEFYLVCHLYGTAPARELVTASQRCAEAAAELLTAVVPQVRVQPFGAGPFLPRGAMPTARLEIVLPHLLLGVHTPPVRATSPAAGATRAAGPAAASGR